MLTDKEQDILASMMTDEHTLNDVIDDLDDVIDVLERSFADAKKQAALTPGDFKHRERLMRAEAALENAIYKRKIVKTALAEQGE